MKKEYMVELYYGYEESESGIYHAFEALDPNVETDADKMATHLAEQLDLKASDDNFNSDSMLIRLPDSVVDRIKADAIQEYLTKNACT